MFNLFLLLSFFLIAYSKTNDAVSALDIEKYLGRWYQVYGDNFDRLFQLNGRCVYADYKLVDENLISVYNSQLDKNDKEDFITGYAYYKEGDCCGYLTVKLQDNPEAPYWVLSLGPVVDNFYDYSIVSDDKGLSLFVLTRDVDRFYKEYDEEVMESLTNFGFTRTINSPTKTNQTDCNI